MSTMELLSKKRIDKLGSTINEAVGSKISSFARKHMEKMGWVEGSGLGKNKDGITSHIKVSTRLDNAGLISTTEKEETTQESAEWWHQEFHKNSIKFIEKSSKKKKKKQKEDAKESKKRKRDKCEVEDKTLVIPSFDDLFKATGGVRLGMRARTSQIGKIRRTEGEV